MQGVDRDPVPPVGESHPEQVVVGDEPQATVGVPVHVSGRMGDPPGPGHAGKGVHQGEGLQVDDVHASRRGDPQPAESIFNALVDKVADERRIRLGREPYERVPVVADQSSSEGADPGVPLVVEVDSVDILVRKPVLSGQPMDDEIVFRVRLGLEPSGEQDQAGKNRQ